MSDAELRRRHNAAQAAWRSELGKDASDALKSDSSHRSGSAIAIPSERGGSPAPVSAEMFDFESLRPPVRSADEGVDFERQQRIEAATRAYNICFPSVADGGWGKPDKACNVRNPNISEWAPNDRLREFVKSYSIGDGNALVTAHSNAGKTRGAFALVCRLWRELIEREWIDEKTGKVRHLSPEQVYHLGRFRIMNAVKIIAARRDSWGKKVMTPLYRELLACRLLIVMEVGPQAPELPGQNDLFELVDGRANAGRDTVIMSGFPADRREFELDPHTPDLETLESVYGFQFVRRLIDPRIGRRVPCWSSTMWSE